MASPFIDRAKETLLQRCDRERVACDVQNFKLPVTFDLGTALAIIGNLQLALRHPANVGPPGRIARETIDGMIRTMRECGLTAHAELARLGDDPDWDQSRDGQLIRDKADRATSPVVYDADPE